MENNSPMEHGVGEARLPVQAQIEIVGTLYLRFKAILLAYARRRLKREQIPEAEYSGEDTVQSSNNSLLERIVRGKVDFTDRADDFLKIMRRIIADKVIAKRDELNAQKRGGAGIRHQDGGDATSGQAGHEPHRIVRGEVPDNQNLFRVGVSAPDVDTITFDMFHALMGLLDKDHHAVAVGRFGEKTIEEIARELGVSTRTIDRRLARIREIWLASGLLERD